MSIYVNFENMFKAFHVWLLINCNVCGGCNDHGKYVY